MSGIVEVENRLREFLLPVLGLDSIDEIQPGASLIGDIGADSIDFVEIIYLIERHFGVVIKTNDIFTGGSSIDPDVMFENGGLSENGAKTFNDIFKTETRFKTGMTKIDIFSSISTRDIANVVKAKIAGEA